VTLAEFGGRAVRARVRGRERVVRTLIIRGTKLVSWRG